MLLLGSHVPMKKPDNYAGAVKTALSYGANSLMIYSGAPQNTIRTQLDELQINQALKMSLDNDLSCNNFVGHAPYIVNLANSNPQKRAFAVEFLTAELRRFAAMKINKMVLHSGNFLKSDLTQAITWVAQGLDLILENTSDLNIKIALETMAGKGTEIGKTLEELRQIRNLVKNRTRISFCLDTCHLFDAGYDLKNNLMSFWEDVESILGIENISAIHINDSKNTCKSHKDRHENIGFGQIGFKVLSQIIYHPAFLQIPKILETPYINSQAPYLEEIKMIKSKRFNPELKNLFY